MARDKNEAINSYITDMLALEDHIEKAEACSPEGRAPHLRPQELE